MYAYTFFGDLRVAPANNRNVLDKRYVYAADFVVQKYSILLLSNYLIIKY